MEIHEIAAVCHEVNRAYCAAIGDHSQVPWDEAPEWQRQSAIAGVKAKVENPSMGPKAQHDGWLALKVSDGWVYGPVKDAEAKTHPCCVPYYELPADQKVKDALFGAIVTGLMA